MKTQTQTQSRPVLPLATRVGLPLAAQTLRAMQPAAPVVFVSAKDGEVERLRKQVALLTKERDTLTEAQLRRERVQAILRPVPQVIVTSSAVHVLNTFDANAAVTIRLPLVQRVKLWLKSL